MGTDRTISGTLWDRWPDMPQLHVDFFHPTVWERKSTRKLATVFLFPCARIGLGGRPPRVTRPHDRLSQASVPAGIVQTPVGRCSDKRRAAWDQVEGCAAILIPCGRIGRPAFDKRFDGLRMALKGRLVQRGVAILVPCGRIGPAFDKRLDGLRMASLSAGHTSSVSYRLASFRCFSPSPPTTTAFIGPNQITRPRMRSSSSTGRGGWSASLSLVMIQTPVPRMSRLTRRTMHLFPVARLQSAGLMYAEHAFHILLKVSV